MGSSRQALGRWGEDQAAAYLAGAGYTLLGRNLRTPYGEIDLLMRQGETLVFVEVKTRAGTSLGYPEISVNARKQAHLLAAAQAYLQARPELEGDWRVDVIAVQRLAGMPPQITHFENAVQG
jgi:putative endonuclease